jgi:hypothetical protein
LAGVFHWSYDQIMDLDAEAFDFSVQSALKFLKWKNPKK